MAHSPCHPKAHHAFVVERSSSSTHKGQGLGLGLARPPRPPWTPGASQQLLAGDRGRTRWHLARAFSRLGLCRTLTTLICGLWKREPPEMTARPPTLLLILLQVRTRRQRCVCKSGQRCSRICSWRITRRPCPGCRLRRSVPPVPLPEAAGAAAVLRKRCLARRRASWTTWHSGDCWVPQWQSTTLRLCV